MLINLKSTLLVLVMISSMYNCTCMHLRATVFTLHEPLAVKQPLFSGGYPYLTLACAGLRELKGSEFELLKFTFNAKNFIRKLFGSISSRFGATHSLMCVAARNHEKFTKTPNFRGSKLFNVTDVNKTKKPVTSACYDKQHVCIYLQSFSH